jgi:endo-1,4-beta-xylanase
MTEDKLSRRNLIGAAIGFLGSSINSDAVSSTRLDAKGTENLRRCAASMLGVAISNDVLLDPAARQVILDHFQGITCDSAMKCRVIAHEKGKYNFGPADKAVRFSQRHGLRMRGHTLLWHQGMPPWLNKMISAGEGTQIVHEYIRAVSTYFQGKIMAWDVVNEPLSNSYSSDPLKSTILTNGIGSRIIEEAFFISQEADPHSKKYLNDFFFLLPDELCRKKIRNCLIYAEKLLSKGVPIHGVGLQCHLNAGTLLPFKERINFFLGLKSLGLEISITELDVRDLVRRDSIIIRDEIIANTIEDLMHSLAYSDIQCPVFTWGLSDKYHTRVIIDKIKKGDQRPAPFDQNFKAKKFMKVLENYKAN